MPAERSSGLAPMGHLAPASGFAQPMGLEQQVMTPLTGSPMFAPQVTSTPYPPNQFTAGHSGITPGHSGAGPMGTYPQVASYPHLPAQPSWLIALLALGAAVGTALALLMSA